METAFGAYELKAPKKFSQEEIDRKLKEEYQQRLKKHRINTDPNSIRKEDWKENVHEWPNIDDGMLFSYILRVKAVDVDYIGKYKDQKAYSYWLSGFVDTVYHASCNDNLLFLKAYVSPSMTHIMCGIVLRDQRINQKSLHRGAPVLQELVRYAIM